MGQIRAPAIAALGLAIGCGSSSPPPAAQSGPQAGPPGSMTRGPAAIATPPLTSDDVEVARVNGRPVWGSCIATQARAIAGARTPQQRRAGALDQCIAFELLAQAAEAGGVAQAGEVTDAARAAAVNRLVETDFEQRYRTPDDLEEAVDAVMKRNEWRMHILELRASTFARFQVPRDAPAELDARAHALADRLADELAGQTGLYDVHLVEAARRIAAGSDIKLDTADVRPTHRDDLVEPYSRALYAIPEVGRIGPVARTQWGWDVVLWTGGVEAKERTRDEVVGDMFPELRRHQFRLWATQLGKQLGVHIEVDQATAARLDTSEAPGETP
jgi:hypothetical protein